MAQSSGGAGRQGGSPRTSGWLGGRVGGSTGRSGSLCLWPPAPVRPCIGACRRPFSVVFGGIRGGLRWCSVAGRFGGTYTTSTLAGGQLEMRVFRVEASVATTMLMIKGLATARSC
jgi:hypothetical protein